MKLRLVSIGLKVPGNDVFNLASADVPASGDPAVHHVPDTISYGTLLLVINERLKLPRTLDEQRYFVELANQLIQLYWQQLDEEQRQKGKAA